MPASQSTPPARSTPPLREFLLQLLDEAYDHASWHGPNLKSTIRRISLPQAIFRPASDRRNIWEQMLHAAYWKYVAWRRLTGEKRGSFPLKGSNWFPRPAPGAETETDWKREFRLLDEQHRALREAVARLPAARLSEVPPGAKVTVAQLLRGVALHDIYHAGQIQLLKRLSGEPAHEPN